MNLFNFRSRFEHPTPTKPILTHIDISNFCCFCFYVEIFKDKKYNIHENHDLRALERRLPKGWKKAKWTPRINYIIFNITATFFLLI